MGAAKVNSCGVQLILSFLNRSAHAKRASHRAACNVGFSIVELDPSPLLAQLCR